MEKTKSDWRSAPEPGLISEVDRVLRKKNASQEELFKNTLRKEFGVVPEDVESCSKELMENFVDYGLIQNIKGNDFLQIDKLASNAKPSSEVSFGETDETQDRGVTPSAAPEDLPAKPRVFVSHSKNKKIPDQLKQML